MMIDNNSPKELKASNDDDDTVSKSAQNSLP